MEAVVGDVCALPFAAGSFDCVTTNWMLYHAADIDLALKSHVVLCLAEMSERLGLMLYFDEKTREVKTGDGKVIPAISYDSIVPMST